MRVSVVLFFLLFFTVAFSAVQDFESTMFLVERGSFIMGDTWGIGYMNERPPHSVTFTYDFYIGKYQVTFDEYDAFCDDTRKRKPGDEGWGRETRPVISISWWDAIAYCNWLSEREGLPVAYRLRREENEGQMLDAYGNVTTDITKVVGYRLPTEAEWEFAARGGNKSNDYRYSGSDDAHEVAWYGDNSTGTTQKVGTRAPNELGLFDMSGNVYEWCSDGPYSYTDTPRINPYTHTGATRVLRGGGWYGDKTIVRVSYRDDVAPIRSGNAFGFRVARTAQ